MSFKIKRGLKKLGSMVEMESPKELARDIKYFRKHPVSFAWDIELGEEEQTGKKSAFKDVKVKEVKKGFKEIAEELFRRKKEKKEKGFWK